MDELVNKVNKTISNLKGKNEFLREQEIQYAHIKQQLLAYNSDAVSYTHLDVYKRQVYIKQVVIDIVFKYLC